MANEQQVNELLAKIDKALAYQDKDLITRTDWGLITFEEAGQDITRMFTVLAPLKELPLEYLPDQAIDEMVSPLDYVTTTLEGIDAYDIRQANHNETHDNLITETHASADSLYIQAAPWIPFLAYQKGDVAQNIQALTDSRQEARNILETTGEYCEEKEKEIDDIITTAREASAAAGAAVFTEDFKKEAQELADTGKTWLTATGVFASLTVVVAIAFAFWFQLPSGVDTGGILQRVGSKFVLLGILFGATLWCGRIYRAQMHQSATNKHRGLSIQTVQAFHHSAADPAVKDTVVLEAARAIYANVPTGLVDVGTQGQGTRVIEVAKSVISKSPSE